MMRTRHSLKPFAAVLSLMLGVGSAQAQAQAAADASTATTNAARARFQEGVDLFDRGDFEGARVSFLQALSLKRHPSVLLNIAQCALRSNRPLEAKRSFEAFLAESASPSPTQRDEARRGIEAAAAKVPRIVVEIASARRLVIDNVASPVSGRGGVVEVEVGPRHFSVEGEAGTVLREGDRVFASGERFELRVADSSPVVAPVLLPVASGAPVLSLAPVASGPADSPVKSATAGSFGSSIFDEPAQLAPVYVGLGVGAVGTVGAVVFFLAKQQAATHATEAEALIVSRGGGPGACGSSGNPAQFGTLCSSLRENYNAVDTDALLGNISLGAAIAGTAFGTGWYLFAPKKVPGAETGLVVAPHLDLFGRDKILGVVGYF